MLKLQSKSAPGLLLPSSSSEISRPALSSLACFTSSSAGQDFRLSATARYAVGRYRNKDKFGKAKLSTRKRTVMSVQDHPETVRYGTHTELLTFSPSRLAALNFQTVSCGVCGTRKFRTALERSSSSRSRSCVVVVRPSRSLVLRHPPGSSRCCHCSSCTSAATSSEALVLQAYFHSHSSDICNCSCKAMPLIFVVVTVVAWLCTGGVSELFPNCRAVQALGQGPSTRDQNCPCPFGCAPSSLVSCSWL